MAQNRGATTPEGGDIRARLVAVMAELELPAPERMLGRIERMLKDDDRERVLRQLLEDFQSQSRDEIRKILKVLAPGGDEWERAVERLVDNYRPVSP